MHGYIANTDYDWYSFLSAQPRLTEVNFWQPSGGQAFRAIQSGEPFFFKLKKPYYAVAGFGSFARHSNKKIALPSSAHHYPDKESLEWHQRARFLGT